jgi:hypothetical protein
VNIDLSNLWKRYQNNKISLPVFIEEYKDKITEKKDDLINKISEECWVDIEKILSEFNYTDKEKAFDDIDTIYDWGDKWGVKIIS